MEYKIEVWKFKINEKTDLKTVEAALAEASRKVMEKAYPEGPYGLIERIDIRGKSTRVIISGNQKTAEEFSKALETHVPNAKVALSKVSQAAITSLDE